MLRLIAGGKSNREIADQLGRSMRTVERHITNLYAKIDARGKADATAYAFRHRLVLRMFIRQSRRKSNAIPARSQHLLSALFNQRPEFREQRR